RANEKSPSRSAVALLATVATSGHAERRRRACPGRLVPSWRLVVSIRVLTNAFSSLLWSVVRGGVVPGGGGHRPPGLGGERQRCSAARSRAARLRGLRAVSAGDGRIGLRVRIRSEALCPQVQTGWRGGQMQSLDSSARKRFTAASSNEWKAITTRRPPGERISTAPRRPS